MVSKGGTRGEGLPRPWLQRRSLPNSNHTWKAYQTQGLGSHCPPEVTVMVISGAGSGTQA